MSTFLFERFFAFLSIFPDFSLFATAFLQSIATGAYDEKKEEEKWQEKEKASLFLARRKLF